MQQGIKIAVISVVVSVIAIIAAFNMPAHFLSFQWWFGGMKYGTTLITLNSTDVLSNFPTTYNANNTALNNGKFELSDWYATTSAAQLTTLANLATVGTITSGTWNASTLTVSHGGTGSSTLSANELFVGNGTGNVLSLGWGNSGQILTSNGAGSIATWQSATFDQTQNYNFTGTNLFKNFNASSTVANPIVLNGVSYNTPSSQGNSGTVLTNDGSGALAWSIPKVRTLSVSGFLTTANTGSTTLLTVAIPANTLSTTGYIRITAQGMQDQTNIHNCFFDIRLGNGNATTSVGSMTTGSSLPSQIVGTVMATSTGNQSYFTLGSDPNGTIFSHGAYSSYSNTGTLYVDIQGKVSVSGTCVLAGESIEALSN